jgi:hypothetical protein
MRVLESVRRLSLRKIIDIVGSIKAHSLGNFPQAGSNHVIGAGSVAADAQTSDDFAFDGVDIR